MKFPINLCGEPPEDQDKVSLINNPKSTKSSEPKTSKRINLKNHLKLYPPKALQKFKQSRPPRKRMLSWLAFQLVEFERKFSEGDTAGDNSTINR